MRESSLREFERRFRASGDLEDELAWLRARLQAGELDPLRLELAARCGHPAALRLAPLEGGQVAPEGAWWRRLLPWRRGSAAARWSEGLARLDAETAARVWLALLHELLPEFEARYPGEAHSEPRAAGRAAALLLACPCPEHREEAEELELACGFVTGTEGYGEPWGDLTHGIAALACGSARGGEQPERGLELTQAARLLGWERARAAVARTLVPWLLGLADPALDGLGTEGGGRRSGGDRA